MKSLKDTTKSRQRSRWMLIRLFLPTANILTVFTDGTPSVADKIERFVKLIGCDSIAAPNAKTVYFIRA